MQEAQRADAQSAIKEIQRLEKARYAAQEGVAWHAALKTSAILIDAIIVVVFENDYE